VRAIEPKDDRAEKTRLQVQRIIANNDQDLSPEDLKELTQKVDQLDFS